MAWRFPRAEILATHSHDWRTTLEPAAAPASARDGLRRPRPARVDRTGGCRFRAAGTAAAPLRRARRGVARRHLGDACGARSAHSRPRRAARPDERSERAPAVPPAAGIPAACAGRPRPRVGAADLHRRLRSARDLELRSSTSSPCFSRTWSDFTSATTTPFERFSLVDRVRLAAFDFAQERRRDVADHRRAGQRVNARLHRGLAIPPSAIAGGAARRVGLNSTRSTVSLRASMPPSIRYSGSSATATGCGATAAGDCDSRRRRDPNRFRSRAPR